jgi:hypothetical protein
LELKIFNTRECLINFCLKNVKRAAEIGVRDGDNSRFILANSPSLVKLYGIDIRYSEKVNINDSRFDYMIVDSVSAASKFPDEYFGFIYIDAGHSYNNVYNDLLSWYPKLKNGGFLVGDDYAIMYNPTEGEYGVVQAIEDFIIDHNKDIYITQHGYIEKDKRLSIAKEIGKKAEDNLYIIHDYLFPNDQAGRKRTENLHIPNWMIIK